MEDHIAMENPGKHHIHIGTSGWHYKHWKGLFYPEDLGQTKWLTFYSEQFKTVEVNSSFYRLPSEKTFREWRESVPEKFVFSVKASRYITHMKKLNENGYAAQDALRLKEMVAF